MARSWWRLRTKIGPFAAMLYHALWGTWFIAEVTGEKPSNHWRNCSNTHWLIVIAVNYSNSPQDKVPSTYDNWKSYRRHMWMVCNNGDGLGHVRHYSGFWKSAPIPIWLIQLMEGFCNCKHKLFLYILFLPFSHMCVSVWPILIYPIFSPYTIFELL